MKIYKSLNNLFEQPFFKKIVEIFKFFKLQKNYWSAAFILILFIVQEAISLSVSENIQKFTQNKIQGAGRVEKIFWDAVEFVFTNGSWWVLLLGIVLFLLVSLVRVYEVKFSNNATQKFEPNLEWAKEKISLSLNSVGDRYITYNRKEYEKLNQPIAIQDYFLHVTNNEELNISEFLLFLNGYTFESLQTKYKEFSDIFKRYTDKNSLKLLSENYELKKIVASPYIFFQEKYEHMKIIKDSNEALQSFKKLLEKHIESNKSFLYSNEFIEIINKIKTSVSVARIYVNDLGYLWSNFRKEELGIDYEYGFRYLPQLISFYDNNLRSFEFFFIEKKNNLSSLSSGAMFNNINKNDQLSSYLFKHTLISGEAMSGKTHILSDIAEKRINNLKPTILIYAQKFEGYGRPIQHIMKQLQLEKYNYSDDEFLEVLDKWGQSSREIVFLIIDAINETTDKKVWPNHFIEFVSQVKKYKNIALIMSIRDVEKEWLFNDDIKNYILGNMVELVHKGFENIEYTVLKKFCEVFKIDLPSFPLLSPIFTNPGLLFLFFETLQKNGVTQIDEKVLKPNFIINEYIKDINKRFKSSNALINGCTYVHTTTNIVAKEIVENKFASEFVAYNEILHKTIAIHEKILDYLISEGLFLQKKDTLDELFIYFSYQRFGNYFLALYLLPESFSIQDIQNKEVVKYLIENHHTYKMIVEALFIRLNETHKLDFEEVFPELFCDQSLKQFKYQCLSKSQDIPLFIKQQLDGLLALSNEDRFELFDFILHSSIENTNDFNAGLYLHKLLKPLDVAQRDYHWSIYIHNSHRGDGIVKRIIDWAWDKNTDFDINDESLYLYGLTLGWFLTSSNRVLRDGATKAMVNLFTDKVDGFLKVLASFEEVNDLYVSERLHAVAYGIALRSSRRSGFEALALYLYKTVFDVEYIVEHILLRDYAKLTVEHIHSIFPLAVDISKIFPPYNQHIPWEIPKIEKSEVEKYRNDFLMMYGSSLDGDFQRYTVRHVINDFINLKIANRPHKKLPKQRYDEFFDLLTDEQNELYQKTLISPSEMMKLLKSKTEYFEDSEEMMIQSISDERQEYRKQKIQTSGFLESLTSEQYKEYTEFIVDYSFSSYDSHTLDYQSVERYIFLEAMRLGWDKELFEDFDRSMGAGRMHDNSFERIGKKYQWIALHKVLAQLSDNYELLDDNSHKKIDKYEGTYQFLSIRDIDPTTILKSKKEAQDKWWFSLNINVKDTALSNVEWMQSSEKLPTVSSLVDIQKDEASYFVQHMQFSINSDEYAGKYRNLYYHINAFLIEKDSVKDFIGWAQKNNLYGMHTQIPKSHHFSEPYLREYPYSKAYDYINIDYYQQPHWQSVEGTSFNILLTSTSYFNEGKSFDKSVNESIEIALPNKWLVEQMQLKQTLNDGEWIDSTGRVVFFDPTVNSCCLTRYNENSVLFADKKLLLEFLEKNHLTLVWIMWGEKQVRNAGDNYRKEDSLGIAEIQSISYWDGSKIVDKPIKIRYEKRS